MRRIFMLVLLVIVIPFAAVSAQNNQLLFDLTEESYLDVTDLGFRLYYPEGWIFDNTQGITLVENEGDVEAIVSGDSSEAEGLFMRVLGLPAGDIDGFETITLEEAAEQLMTTLGATETERVEGAVLARRALMLVGTSENERAGILTVWKQPDYLVIATLSTPDMDTLFEYAYSWGYLLGAIHPLDTMPLNPDPITLDSTGLTIRHPDGWTVSDEAFGPGTVAAFELESDVTNTDTMEGYVFGAVETSLANTEFTGDTALTDYAAALAANQGFGEDILPQEYKLLDYPAVTYTGLSETGEYGFITVIVVDETAVTLVASAPTEELYEEFLPTWTAMLQSVRAG